MEEKYCQSCGMPLNEEKIFGTNGDGSKNEDYCVYCYKDGAYTADCTMDAMIEFCIPHMVAANADMNEDAARAMMRQFFPTLKRWK